MSAALTEAIVPDVLAVAFREIRAEFDRRGEELYRLRLQRDALGEECLRLRTDLRKANARLRLLTRMPAERRARAERRRRHG